MMALDNYFLSSHQQPPSLLLLDWDSHSFEGHSLHHILPLPLPLDTMESPISSDSSTGYLEDAVADWTDRCKRRRVGPCDFRPTSNQDLLDQGGFNFWGSNCLGTTLGSLNCLFQDNTTTVVTDGDFMNFTMPIKELEDKDLFSPSSSSEEYSMPTTSTEQDIKASHHLPLTVDNECETRRKKVNKKIVYPFAVVKPLGLEGDVTLADINERILKRPTRPVRHPVGEFAIRPLVSGDGPGLSGKAVVGLTRIHTQGRGTITIIRTRG